MRNGSSGGAEYDRVCHDEEGNTMKERRIRCKQCGDRFTVLRFERERTSAYCDLCREDRKREQARARMRTMRARLTKHIHRCPTPSST